MYTATFVSLTFLFYIINQSKVYTYGNKPLYPPGKCSKVFCGGKQDIQCCQGLTCIHDRDIGGTCVRVPPPTPPPSTCAQLFERCGQGIRCCDNNQCLGGDPTAPDPINRYGVCRPPCNNNTCGGLLGVQCCPGFECIPPTQCCDFPGTCRRCGSQGQQCGGFGGYGPCCSGLECDQPGGPEFAGTCQFPTCSRVGGICAGFAGFQCCPGLTCNAPNLCCDFSGTCEPPCKTDGQQCYLSNAIGNLPCCSGYFCNATAQSPGVCLALTIPPVP